MLTVSNYHYIRENFNTQYPSIFGVTPQLFKKQILLLKDKGDFVSTSELIAHKIDILQSKTNLFYITFDDGLKEQYQYALPILDELNIPTVLFANSRNYEDKKVSTVHKIHLIRSVCSPSNFLSEISQLYSIQFLEEDKNKAKSIYTYDDSDSAVLKYVLNFKMEFSIQEQIIQTIFKKYFDEKKVLEELYLNKNQLLHLGTLGFLGSHTHNHYPVGLLKTHQIQFELENSKKYFEDLTNTKIESVAYPYGTPEASTSEVAQIANKVGYKIGFTTNRGVNVGNENHLLLNRFDCNDMPGGKNYIQI